MLDLYTYQLPFNQPFKTGSTSFSTRSGLILRFKDSSSDAISEAAPLPGFSKDGINDVINSVETRRRSIQQFFKNDFDLSELKSFSETFHELPSLQFALEMLGIELLCQRNRSAVSKILGLSTASNISVNTVIGTGSKDEIYDKIEADYNKGFRVFKIKVGKNPNPIAKILHDLHQEYPEITFRLDANQTWPIEKVREYSSLFLNLPIEYVEEPSFYNSENELDKITNNCVLPVALDESVTDLDSFSDRLKNEKVQVFVIKPTIFGSILKFIDTISSRNHLIDKIVITSAFESGVGLNQIACLAALSGSKSRAHGLNTNHYFKHRLVEKFVIKNAGISFSGKSGFGIVFNDLDSKLLKGV